MELKYSLVTGVNKLGKEIADALGLKHVRSLDFHIQADGLATVTAEMFPEVDGVKKFPAILKKFKLEVTELESEVLSGDTSGEITELGEEIRNHDFDWLAKNKEES